MTTAALGGSIEVPTIEGARAKVTIPEGTQSGAQFRLRGKGMPVVKGGGRAGDMIIQVNIEVPVKLSKKQKELLAEFDKECKDSSNNPNTQSFFSKVTGFFKD
jgi:molecular chaperone DnaJ